MYNSAVMAAWVAVQHVVGRVEMCWGRVAVGCDGCRAAMWMVATPCVLLHTCIVFLGTHVSLQHGAAAPYWLCAVLSLCAKVLQTLKVSVQGCW